MKAETRLIVSALLRLLFIGFAAWFAIEPDALPGAPIPTRIAISAVFLVIAVLIGEITTMRTHMALLLAALRGERKGAPPRDDRAAVDVLVRALGSDDPAVREKAHRHLQRLTGQDLPEDAARWTEWWVANREGFGKG